MFIIIKWFFLCTFVLSATIFSVVPTTFAFSNPSLEENNINMRPLMKESEQQLVSDEKLNRKRRAPGKNSNLKGSRGSGSSSRQSNYSRTSSGGSGSSSRQSNYSRTSSGGSGSSSRQSNYSRTSSGSRLFSSAGSSHRASFRAGQPLRGVTNSSSQLQHTLVTAPNSQELANRITLLQNLSKANPHPFNFTDPYSSKLFELKWLSSNPKNPDQGMKHILKRHTHEYYDGSITPGKHTMFPKGTSHQEIVNMIEEVVSNPSSKTIKRQIDGFRQIQGVAKNGTPLVVGYLKNRHSLDIMQAYPKGNRYAVRILPPVVAPVRNTRGIVNQLWGSTSDSLNSGIDIFLGQSVEKIKNSPFFQADLEKMFTFNTTLRALSIGFSNPLEFSESLEAFNENQAEKITISWEEQPDHIVHSKNFSLYKSFRLNRLNTSLLENKTYAVFKIQPEKNTVIDYFISCVYGPNNDTLDSAAVRIGAEKITNLKATILSDHKIRINWDPLNPQSAVRWEPTINNYKDPIKLTWKIVRNTESIDIEDNITSFEDEVEPNQVYVYRVMAFMEEENPSRNQQHAIFYSKPLIVSTEQREVVGQDQFQFYTYLLKENPYDLNTQPREDENYYISIHSFEDKQVCMDIIKKSIVTWDNTSSENSNRSILHRVIWDDNQPDDQKEILDKLMFEDTTKVEMLNGLIDVECNGRSLVPPTCFTNVRMLWDYLLALVEEYLEKEQATIYFPDQPMPFSLKKKSQGMMEFQVGDKFVTIDEKKCLTAILQGAELFFTLLNAVSIDEDGVGRHDKLLEQINFLTTAIDLRVNLRPQQPPVQTTLIAQAERIAFNRVLLNWPPIDGAESYKIFLDEQEIIALPAHKTSYIHIYQPKEQKEEEWRVYKLVGYDEKDVVIANKYIHIDIENAYLQVEKLPLPFELNWKFPEESLPFIKYYKIFCDDVSLGLTESPNYTETAPVLGTSIYTIEALDSSKNTLEVEPIVKAISISKLTKLIKLKWIFPKEDILSCRRYHLYRNGISLGAKFGTTWVERRPLDVGEYTYKIDAIDPSCGKDIKAGSLQEKISIVPEDILDLTVPNPTSLVQAISQVLVKRISADQVQLSWKPSIQNIKRYEVLINNTFLIGLPGNEKKYTHRMEQTECSRNRVYTLIAYDQNDKSLEPYSIDFEITYPFFFIKEGVFVGRELSWGFSEQDMDAISSYKIFLNNICIANNLSKETTTYLDQQILNNPGVYTYRIEPMGEDNTPLEIQPVQAEVAIPYVTAKVTDGNIVELSWDFFKEEGVNIEKYMIAYRKCFDRDRYPCTDDRVKLVTVQGKSWKGSLDLAKGRYTFFVIAEGTSLASYDNIEIE